MSRNGFSKIACVLGLMLAVPAGLHAQEAAPGGTERAATPFVTNALGDSSADLVYTPVTPCRVFDTRLSAAGILVGGTQRNFLVAGSTGFTAQGGNAAGCAVPFGVNRATAVVINLAAVNPAGGGNLRAWAVASPQPAPPTAAVLNYSPTLAALANAVVVPICDDAATSCAAGDLRLQADISSVHVVGDVLGYFQRPGRTMSGTITARYAANSGFFLAGASYPVPLPVGAPLPTLEYVPGAPTATCPGFGQAAAGRLCIYAFNTSNVTGVSYGGGNGGGTELFGFSLDVFPSNAAANGYIIANWAVTIP